ncbi:ABC transporter ATP-binding protein [Mangrovitalea sediminis]|uniref:ABC transporter ATP-binding protein n=1 Tax=Mangrovitalea sediminis TaxID=1982043 RepID=UPI000BE4C8B0|nr:ABC transporter ATP-binding protein [Mangrovitalea sediminis]
MTHLINVEGVSKRFSGVQAVNGVSFYMDEGEILGLIGPNGAGKTTLFNLVSGVIPPDEGRVTMLGEDITGMAPYNVVNRGLARTHQIVKPLNDMTVLENVTVGACFGREKLQLGKAREHALKVLHTVGLADRKDVLAVHLTIAGKKRLEVARALAGNPRLLLLDEVLAGLNPTEVAGMIEVIRTVRKETGIGILMIEHLMQAVMSLSDRVMVLNFGELLATGTPEEVANHPHVVEAYLGDPNMAEKLMARQ